MSKGVPIFRTPVGNGGILTVNSGTETRTWTYAYTTNKLVETNEQTGMKVELQGSSYITRSYLTPTIGSSQISTYTRDAKGNLTSMSVGGDARYYTVTTLPSGNTK